MSLYAAVISLHVIVAVVGIGLLGAVPLVAAYGGRAGLAPSATAGLLESLLRYTRWSLATMALTGGLLDYAAGGGFHSSGWFRASVALFLLLAVMQARARAALRKGLASGTFRRVERWGWTMCATVVLIVVLMEIKPF